MALLPKYQGMGANAVLYAELVNSLKSMQFEHGDLVQVDIPLRERDLDFMLAEQGINIEADVASDILNDRKLPGEEVYIKS